MGRDVRSWRFYILRQRDCHQRTPKLGRFLDEVRLHRRRVQDPLAELVKLDPKHIGVGMYQHDAKTGALDKELDYVVESAVASVGVDLNTASISLLSRVPGMNKTVAKNVVEEREKRGRTYSSKIDAKSVKGCGEKTFEQIAGFLRVAESEDILDRTALHTESYAAARKLLKRCANDAVARNIRRRRRRRRRRGHS